MLAALLLLQAAPQTAIDAERAFNRAAQTQGQWTAFRAFMAPDATVFTPQPEKAATALPTKNPPIAVQWWPADSYVSCDGKVAVNTGPWVRPDSFGYFTTVWQRSERGWRWIVDAGDALNKARELPEKLKVRRASCATHASVNRWRKNKHLAQTVWIVTGVPTIPGVQSDQGTSPDGSLRWFWVARPNGSRTFLVELWNGRDFDTVIHDEVAAQK